MITNHNSCTRTLLILRICTINIYFSPTCGWRGPGCFTSRIIPFMLRHHCVPTWQLRSFSFDICLLPLVWSGEVIPSSFVETGLIPKLMLSPYPCTLSFLKYQARHRTGRSWALACTLASTKTISSQSGPNLDSLLSGGGAHSFPSSDRNAWALVHDNTTWQPWLSLMAVFSSLQTSKNFITSNIWTHE